MNSVSSWFGSISKQITDLTTVAPDEGPLPEKDAPKEPAEEAEKKEGEVTKEPTEDEAKEGEEPPKGVSSSLSLGDIKADQVLQSTKDIGNALFGWTKSASKTVADKAVSLKHQFEEKTILGEFEAEQARWIEEKEVSAAGGAAEVAPWVGFPDESLLKKRILALSLDTRNFLRDPPGDGGGFDYAAVAATAAAALEEDPNLRKMRFHLVPKQVKEERFWRNYFYRVNLVKQSAELETLGVEEEAGHSPGTSRSASEKSWGPQPDEETHEEEAAEDDVRRSEDAPPEFVSDGHAGEVSPEELERVRAELGIVGESAAGADWEADVLADLNDFELVEGQDGAKSEADWEKEISDLLDAEDGGEHK